MDYMYRHGNSMNSGATARRERLSGVQLLRKGGNPLN